ncbi:MAG: aminotransferase class IV [Bacteroidota bacterium]
MAYCYFDGALIEESKASISIHNLGVQRGFGIFDFFRGRNGKPTFMEDHLDRFDRSQKFLGLGKLISKDEIREAVEGLQQWNAYQESSFKLMLLGDGSESESELKPLFYITNTDISNHSLPKMSSVILHEHLREMPEIKSINYLTGNALHREKMRKGAIDIVYHSKRQMSEASRSNIFIVRDGVLFTPSINILEGITRKQILKFGSDILPTEEGMISLDQFVSADEIFISSTLKEIMPIVKVDDKKIGNGQVGPFTKKLQERFIEMLNGA